MSFYTTLSFYRPTKPPLVTGRALAGFFRDLIDTGLFERRGANYFSVKFGQAIDQDALGTFVEVPDPQHPSISTMRPIQWDIDHKNISLDDALRELSNDDRTIYRAAISLGSLRADVLRSLQTRRPDRDEMNLHLWDGTMHLGPVELFHLGGEEPVRVGWMDVSLSGNGHLHPWKPRDLTSRAASLDALQPLTQICRRAFPIPDSERLASRSGISQRHEMGELWPFRDLERDADWFWGVCETG
jgi:hypothetical protein